jgi:small subunit ribosomal protein S21
MSKNKPKVSVKVRNNNIQKALSIFKRRVKDSDHLFELRRRKEFLKPSVINRRAKQVAIHKQKLEDIKTKDE